MKKNESQKWISPVLFLLFFIVIISGFAAGLDDGIKDDAELNKNSKIEKVEEANAETE